MKNSSITHSNLIYIALVALTIGFGMLLRSMVFTEIGLGSDDYMQNAMIDGVYPVKRSPFDLFNFADGSEKEREALINFGTIPWWSYPEFRLRMMRPLSSALIYLDYALFGKNEIAFHTHSMLWWAFLIICVALLLHKLVPIRIAMIAVVLFAIEEGNNLPSLWLANRNTLICLSLGTLGLWAHVRWRRNGHQSGLAVSIIMFSLALLAGEWSFAVFGYLLAFELIGTDDPWRTRLLALIPASLLGLTFLIVQQILDYSALYSDVYVNPVTEPLAYIIKAFQRIPVFVAQLLFGVDALWYQEGTPWRDLILSLKIFSPEVWKTLPSWQFWHITIGVIGVLIGFVIIRWGLRNQKDHIRKELHWLLLGALISLLPMVASFPANRLVLPASIGISVIWATIILYAYQRFIQSIKSKAFRPAFFALLVLIGLGYTQIWQASTHSRWIVEAHHHFYWAARQWILQADVDHKTVKEQDIFLINGIEHTTNFFAPFVWNYHGFPMPRSYRILSAAPSAHSIIRTAENELEYHVLSGTMMTSPLEQFYRSNKYALVEGQVVELDEFRVKIIRLKNGKPLRYRFTFNKQLEDPSYLFLRSTRFGMRRFPLPKINESKRVPEAAFPSFAPL